MGEVLSDSIGLWLSHLQLGATLILGLDTEDVPW